MTRGKLIGVACVCLLMLASQAAWAQTTGSIRGRTVDADGQPLPGVTIAITGEVLGSAQRTAVTSPSGGFNFSAMPIGTYTVAADLAGFQKQAARRDAAHRCGEPHLQYQVRGRADHRPADQGELLRPDRSDPRRYPVIGGIGLDHRLRRRHEHDPVEHRRRQPDPAGRRLSRVDDERRDGGGDPGARHRRHGRVRQHDGVGLQRHHQVGHQPVPRGGVLRLPKSRLGRHQCRKPARGNAGRSSDIPARYQQQSGDDVGRSDRARQAVVLRRRRVGGIQGLLAERGRTSRVEGRFLEQLRREDHRSARPQPPPHPDGE